MRAVTPLALPALRRLAACAGLAAALAATPAAARSMNCQSFMDGFNAAAGEHRVVFSRALSVGGRESGYEYYDGSGTGDVDVSVVCRDDRFVRVEVRSARAGAERVKARRERLQQAALRVAAGQDGGRAAGTIRALAAEAQDYLRASAERGDVFVAGKTERHLGGGVDVGYVATETDVALIVVVGS
jgi:hypothetical protein